MEFWCGFLWKYGEFDKVLDFQGVLSDVGGGNGWFLVLSNCLKIHKWFILKDLFELGFELNLGVFLNCVKILKNLNWGVSGTDKQFSGGWFFLYNVNHAPSAYIKRVFTVTKIYKVQPYIKRLLTQILGGTGISSTAFNSKISKRPFTSSVYNTIRKCIKFPLHESIKWQKYTF